MSRIHLHNDNVIDISDSDDEQAVAQPLQPLNHSFVAGDKRQSVQWHAPSGIAATVSKTAKPATQTGAVPSSSTPVPGASSNLGTAVAHKPLMKIVDPIDLTLSSDEDETAAVLPSLSARSTHPPSPGPPRLQPWFIQPGTPSPPAPIVPLLTQKGTPTHNRKVPLLAASPGLGVILVPGRKKRKRKIGSYQPGHGFNDDHDDSTFDPDLPAGKRVRLSMGDAKPDPAPAESVHIRGLAFLKKAAYNDIGRGAPNTGPEFSEKGSKVKRLRKRGENQAAAATKLKRFYLPPCEEPEKDDATITPTYIDNILRTVASDGDAVETRVDLDMSGDPAPRSRTPTTVQHGPPPPPLAREESVASQGLSQRTESTQEVIDVLDFELNLFGNEEEDADLQRALQQDFDMYSSPIRRTVCTPSAIELDNCIGLPRGYPSNLPYGGVPGVGGSWECNDLVPYADEAVSFTGEYLYGPSKRVSNKSEENIPDPFAPHVIDLYRQTIQEQLRVWAENPGADVSLDLADELVATKEKLAMRVAERKLAEDAAGVSRPHEKGDIESFIELDLRPVPSLPEGTLGEGGIIPESPKAEQRSMPEERVVKQAAGMSPSGLTGSGSSRRSTTPGRFAIVDSDMKASDESVGTSQNTALWAESQEVVQSSAPKGVYVSTTGPTGSESAHQEPTPPSKCTGSTLRAHRSRSSQKVTELTIEDLERIMLKRLNLTPEVLAPRKRPVWERLAPLRQKMLRLRAVELARLELEQEPEPDGIEADKSWFQQI